MLKVVEDMYLASNSLSGNNVVALRHVSGLVDLTVMIELLVNRDLISLLMTALGVIRLSLHVMIHRHPNLMNLHLVELTFVPVRSMRTQQKPLIRILVLQCRTIYNEKESLTCLEKATIPL
jgi:hypothetical protein